MSIESDWKKSIELKDCTTCYHSELNENAAALGQLYTCNLDEEKPVSINVAAEMPAFPCDDWLEDD